MAVIQDFISIETDCIRFPRCAQAYCGILLTDIYREKMITLVYNPSFIIQATGDPKCISCREIGKLQRVLLATKKLASFQS